MTTMTDPYAAHYARLDTGLVDALATLYDHWEHFGQADQRAMLDFLLPGVTDPTTCWAELTELLERWIRLDMAAAVDEYRERGARGPIDPLSVYGQMRDELLQEIGCLLRSHRLATARAARQAGAA